MPICLRVAKAAGQIGTKEFGCLNRLQSTVFMESNHYSPSCSTVNVSLILQGIPLTSNNEKRRAQKNMENENCFLKGDMVEENEERRDS